MKKALSTKSAYYMLTCVFLSFAGLLAPGQAAHWVAGQTHPQYDHVIAIEEKGVYKPAPGYVWIDPDGPIGPVRWEPGRKHPRYDHVLADDEEDYFKPEPGYAWDQPGVVGPVHRLAETGSGGHVSNAESLRRFLWRKGALSPPNWYTYSDDLRNLYSKYHTDNKECPVPTFRDQPETASQQAVNIFTVDFKVDPRNLCRNAPNPGACAAIQDNCITVGTSVFCDLKYLDRRASIAKLAYHSAWIGLGRIQAGKSAFFPPLSNDALIDLARMTIADRSGSAYPRDLRAIPLADWLADQADSSVYKLAFSLSLIAPMLHEIAHIEQNYCGRGVATADKGDLFTEFFLTGKKDYEEMSKNYDNLTCSHLSRSEADADLRGMDMLLRYIDEEAPKAIESPWFKFGDQIDAEKKKTLRGLARWSREVAMLSFLYGAEYELLVYAHPEKGLAMIRGEPEITSMDSLSRSFVDYYFNAGWDPEIPRVRGHLEPTFRTIRLSYALKLKRFLRINRSDSVSLVHLRIAPFSIGRFQAMRSMDCGITDSDDISKSIADYVLFAYQEIKPAGGTASRARLKEAYAILERFMRPGADRKALTQALRPRRADYASIFEQPFADKVYRERVPFWENGEIEISLEPDQTELVIFEISSDELRQYGGASNIQGGYRKVSSLIKPGLTIYTWSYRDPGTRAGMKYDGLYFVNGRWVWVPKPYRILEER